MYRVFVFILVNFVWIQTVYSQIVTNANANAVQMSQTLAGAGVTILNPSTTGSPVSSAIFTSAPTSLGIESGVVLTSGAVEAQAFNPGIAGNINESPGFMNNLPGDGDLNSISAVLGETFSTLDASVLEFDIVVEGDSLIFDYVFGSEEYPDGFSNFVCSQFGDVFGFFITGPNPAGGTYNNRNIALVPNSNTPITINTINNGISGGGNANTCILTNTAYFNGQVPGMTYNGFTQVFQAFAATIPCETYHIKLAIADGDGNSGDNTLDSGVFLREGSFSSVGTTISGSTTNVLQTNTAVEGCVAANFRFTIPSPLSTNYIIDFVVGGSATNNVDYASVGTQVIIPAGQTFVDLSILPFEDDLIENPEEVKIYLIHPCNTNTILDSATISIIDFENPNVSIPNDTIICQNTMMNVSAAGGVAYNWYPASAFSNTNGSNTTVITNTEQFLYVDVIDVNNCVVTDSFYLSLHEPPIANAGEDTSVCLNADDVIVFNDVVQLFATGGVDYLWTPSTGLSSSTIANPTASPVENTDYIVEVTDNNGCSSFDTVLVTVLNPSLDLIGILTDSVCIGDTVFVDVLDQGIITDYSWSPAAFITDASVRSPGFFPIVDTEYELSVQNYCYLKKDSVLIEVVPLPNISTGVLDSICWGDSFQLDAHPSDLEYYEWSSSDDPLISDVNIPNPIVSPEASSIYHLFVIDTVGTLACENTASFSLTVYANPIVSMSHGIDYFDFICQGDSVQLIASSNDGIIYNWDNSPFLNSFDSMITNAFPSDTTWFFVDVTNTHTCTTRDSILVNVQEPIVVNADIVGDSAICQGDFATLRASGGLYYHWYPEDIVTNTNAAMTQLNPDSTTIVFVEMSNDCFADTFQREVIVHQLPDVDAGEDKTVVRDDVAAILDGSGDGAPLWLTINNDIDGILTSPSIFSPEVLPFNTLEYVLRITDELTGCVNFDTVTVFVEVHTLVAMPTGFSPNDDGVNDIFHILKTLNIESINGFSIYNRYGELVYFGSGDKAGWDGMCKGREAEIGTYIYVVDGFTKDNEPIVKRGNITLVR